MQKLILSAALAIVCLNGQAQEVINKPLRDASATDNAPLKPELAAQRQTTSAKSDYTLDAAQEKKFYDASLTRINANRPLKKQMKQTTDKAMKKKLHQKIKMNTATFEFTVKAMMTPEQKTKWEAAHPAKIKNPKETELDSTTEPDQD